MFAHYIFTAILVVLFYRDIPHASTESTGNLHILKNEIEKAMRDCEEKKDSNENVKDPYQNRSQTIYYKRDLTAIQKDYKNDLALKEIRKRRNINMFLEQIQRFLQQRYLEDSNSGEWDYGEGEKKKNDRTWDDTRNDKSVMDNMYNHERRQEPDSYYGNSRYGNKSIQQDKNSTQYKQNDTLKNYDSGAARSVPGFRKLIDDKNYNTVKDLNFTTSFYDPFMTRGIRAIHESLSRNKRFDKLVKTTGDNEVDDRGIPKEVLFSKLLQDNVQSQQSKALLENKLKACFDELATDSEEDGCLYSNALDHCMELKLNKRKTMLLEDKKQTKYKI